MKKLEQNGRTAVPGYSFRKVRASELGVLFLIKCRAAIKSKKPDLSFQPVGGWEMGIRPALNRSLPASDIDREGWDNLMAGEGVDDTGFARWERWIHELFGFGNRLTGRVRNAGQ